MGRIWMPGGGGGADLDVVTAGANNVEAGKVIVGPDGEPLTGVLPNLSTGATISHATGNGTPVVLGDAAFLSTNTDGVTRAEIRYNGDKGIIQGNTLIGIPQTAMATAGGLTAAKLANGQSAFGLTGTYKGLGNAAAADVRKGKTFSTAALSNATGTMAEKGAATYTPKTTAQTIAGNQYLTGVQTIAGDANLVAANIKKNVTIFGVKGTWEGYVANAQDLYYQGANPGGFTTDLKAVYASATFLTDRIRIDTGDSSATGAWWCLQSGNSYNLTGYTGIKLVMQVYRDSYQSYSYVANGFIRLCRSGYSSAYNAESYTRVDFTNLDMKNKQTLLIPFASGSHSFTDKICFGSNGTSFFASHGGYLDIFQVSLY